MDPSSIGTRNFVNPLFPILISSVRTQGIEHHDVSYHEIQHRNSARENAALRFKTRTHPSSLPSQVKLMQWENGAQVYLIGTAHLSNASNAQVQDIISKVKPDRVMVELCEERRGLMYMSESTVQTISWAEIKNVIRTKGIGPAMLLLPLLLASNEASQQLHAMPGGEFRVANRECQKVTKDINDDGLVPPVVVAVVGIAHQQGIHDLFNTTITKDEFEDLKSIPNHSLANVVFMKTLTLIKYGGITWILYKLLKWCPKRLLSCFRKENSLLELKDIKIS